MGVGNGYSYMIHDTDKVKGGLMMRFFGLVFSVSPSSRKISADALV